jgi:hypothetical protein
MSLAYYIVLEKKIDGLDTMMNGKSLAHHIESLDEAAKKLGVRPLSDFVSVSSEEIVELLGDDVEGSKPWPLEQFPAKDGLATVSALLAYTQVHTDHVAEDLRECELILKAAAEHGVGWHFQIDV